MTTTQNTLSIDKDAIKNAFFPAYIVDWMPCPDAVDPQDWKQQQADFITDNNTVCNAFACGSTVYLIPHDGYAEEVETACELSPVVRAYDETRIFAATPDAIPASLRGGFMYHMGVHAAKPPRLDNTDYPHFETVGNEVYESLAEALSDWLTGNTAY